MMLTYSVRNYVIIRNWLDQTKDASPIPYLK
jgi:hypothetical protein